MGRSRYRIGDPKAPHFLTCTVLNWMPLFTRPQTVEIMLDALRHRQARNRCIIFLHSDGLVYRLDRSNLM